MILCPKCYEKTDEGYCPNCKCHIDELYARLLMAGREGEKRKRILKIVIGTFTMAILLGVMVFALVSAARDAAEKERFLQEAVEEYIKAEMYEDEQLPLMLQYTNAVLESVEFDVSSCNWQKKTAIVEFTYIDVIQLADSLGNDLLSTDAYYEMCMQRIAQGQYETLTETITVSFDIAQDSCVIRNSEELTNVLSGGALKYYLNLLEGANE